MFAPDSVAEAGEWRHLPSACGRRHGLRRACPTPVRRSVQTEVVKPSERCRRDAELMREFREAYVELLNNSRMVDDFIRSELRPANDEREWQRMRTIVAMAAGAAANAYRRYGGTYTMRNAAYIMPNVDPVANWEMSFKDPEQMPPQSVVSSVEAATARASEEAVEAARRERGLTGVIASFIRWPSDLREAVGAGHPAQRRAAGLIGFVGQVVVSAVAGALTAALVAAVVALWKQVF